MTFEALFLADFFKSLDNNYVHYCVLRNYEALPYDTAGSDIDILVTHKHIKLLCLLLLKAAVGCGGFLITSYYLADACSFCLIWPHGEKSWGVQFDIYEDTVFRGVPYFDSSLVLSRSVIHNNIKVARKGDAELLALLKESLHNGVSRKNYLQEVEKSYSLERVFYKNTLECYFGFRSAVELDSFFMQPNTRRPLQTVAGYARIGLLNKALRLRFSDTIRKKVKYQFFRWRRLFKPLGFSVVFMGTDGSGKSTIIEGIRPPLESALHSKIKYEHMRPNLLPSLARLLGRNTYDQEKPVVNPHESESSGFVGSLLRLAYYSLDYIFGYWLKVYPDRVKKPCLYAFDRYYYDFLIDPVRSRISLPKKLVEWFRFFIPEPDLILCLGADPEVIHTRKPELSLGEVERQIDGLREFCDKTPRAVWVDTGLPVEESINQALSIIVDRMAARYD